MRRLGLLMFALTLALTACATYKAFQPPLAGDIPDGPGLFSGEKGEFELYRR